MAYVVAAHRDRILHIGVMTTTPATSDPTDPPIDAVGMLDDIERARRIRVAVRARSKEVRAAHPILAHQDLIGSSILALSAVGVIGTAVGFGLGALAWWLAVPLAAMFMSLAHEIEHDTIHRMYFSRNNRARSVMFGVCWALRPYTISPWKRRKLHLLHHEASGTEMDFEEMAITNGQTWNLERLLCMIDPLAAALFHLPAEADARKRTVRYLRKAWFPMTYIALAIWYSFLSLALVNVITGGSLAEASFIGSAFAVIQFLAVTWIGPNVLRVACLHFISSNMHYFGDVEDGNVIQQTQVLNRWWLAPMQLFCFNFGSTHGIHHFVPNDPFYVRQMTVKTGQKVMRENGVRFNDFGTFRRANRFSPLSAA